MNPLLKLSLKAESMLAKTNKQILSRFNTHHKFLEQWYKDDPHSLKRSTFDHLGIDSIVFDLGGYEGQWSSDIYARYCSKIHVFEPVKIYADLIQARFFNNPDIIVHPFGLGHDDLQLEISVDAFASSVFNKKTSERELIKIKKFLSFTSENKIETIDLIKINIEGSEFELLEYLAQENYLKNINGLLVQFHSFVPNANERMKAIQQKLIVTHEPIFQYDFIWEYWQRK